MGDDVICIDSDDDDDDEASRAERTFEARAPNRRPGGRRYWRQRRRAQKGRKNDAASLGGAPVPRLLDGLRRLSSEMYVGEWAGKAGRTNRRPIQALAERVHRLVEEFQRRAAVERLSVSARQEGWRQVLKFLFLLRAVGGLPDASIVPEQEDVDAAHNKGLIESAQQLAIGGVNRACSNDRLKKLRQRSGHNVEGNRASNERQERQHYQLTVIDILVDYIRFRCEAVVTRQPPPTPAVLLKECNQIAASLLAIFGGSVELVLLTLLRTVPDRRYTLLLYPVFERILTGALARCGAAIGDIPSYVRLLLCCKRWRSLVTGRADKAIIDAQAMRLLPARCPKVLVASDLPFLRLLPPVPASQRASETRYLLANDLFSLERSVDQYFRHHRRVLCAADERLSNVGRAAPAVQESRDQQQRHRLDSMELTSNYINVTLLAELIELKAQLWSRVFPAPLGSAADTLTPSERCRLQEAHSVVESLRLIFRCRMEFIELTLLRVMASPEFAPLLAPVFATFLTPTDPRTVPQTASATGLAIYRSNDVESYGRLVLCYAKWKALCRTDSTAGDGPEPTEWTRIDAIALSQLPYEFPRVLCRRDARMRQVFSSSGAAPGAGATAGRWNNSATRTLLRTLPQRADLQELCLKFIEAYRYGPVATPPSHQCHEDGVCFLPTSLAEYKSMSTSIDRTERRHWSDGDVAGSVQPTPRADGIGPSRWTELKPIIIPDSDDRDEISASDAFPMVAIESDASSQSVTASSLPNSLPWAIYPLAVSGCAGTTSVAELYRNASNATTVGPHADTGPVTAAVWPPLTECFLNTPPATPQQDVVTDSPEEEHRRSGSVKPSRRGSSWVRLKGIVRMIGRGKKRALDARLAIGHTLRKVFDGDGWWSFTDVLAVRTGFPLNVRWYSSKIKVPTVASGGCAVGEHLASDSMVLKPENQTDRKHNQELSLPRLAVATVDRGSPRDADDRSKDDAMLLELIDCLEAVESSMSFDSTQGSVDFAIFPDNPERAERSQPFAVGDQASPSACGPVDTFPLFALNDSDRFVHLFTELGPVSWPIV